MSSDLQDNGIQMDMTVTKVEESFANLDLNGSQNDFEKFITPVVSPGVMSSYFSSVSSTNKLASRQTLSLSQTEIINNIDSNTMSSLTMLPEGISMSDITDWTFSDNVGSNSVNDINLVQNSTSSFLTSSNETVLQTASSWLPEEIGAVIIVSAMVPFILVSNMIVIISVIRFRRLHTPTNYFITSLAAVDVFVALATPLGIVVEVFNFGGIVQPEDVVLCLLPNRILMMACGVSVLTLATIAYDRQTALVYPLKYVNIMTPKKVAIMVSLTWMYSGLIVWLPLMAGWYDPPTESAPCSANLIHGIAPVLFLSAIFVPSCIAILVCYFRIFMVARHHAKAIAAVEFAVHRSLQVKFIIKNTKYAKTLALVIGVFLVLWLPYLIFIFVQTVCSTKFNIWIQTYLILLTVFNSGINPWLYAFKNNELRAAFKRLFNDICRSKFCKFSDRRMSLVSATSGTPRLSRTDSRIAYIMPEVTLSIVDEKLQRSPDSLDEQTIESKHDMNGNEHRLHTISSMMLPLPSIACFNHVYRQATSCSNLESLGGGESGRVDSGVHSRRFSLDVNLICGAEVQNDVNICELSSVDSQLSCQVDDGVEQIDAGVSTSHYNYEQIISKTLPSLPSPSLPSPSLPSPSLLSSLVPSPSLPSPSLLSSLPSPSLPSPSLPSPSLPSLPSPSLPSPSLPSPSLPSLPSPSLPSLPSPSLPSLPSPSLPSLPSLPSSLSTLQLSPLYLERPTSPSSGRSSDLNCHPSLLSFVCHVDEPNHQTLVPHTTILSEDQHKTSKQHTMYSNSSLRCLKKDLQPAVCWKGRFCLENLSDSSPHPYIHSPTIPTSGSILSDPIVPMSRDQPSLVYTHSCPIFELILPEISNDYTTASHLRKVASELLETRLDFVSLVNKEADYSRRYRYLV